LSFEEGPPDVGGKASDETDSLLIVFGDFRVDSIHPRELGIEFGDMRVEVAVFLEFCVVQVFRCTQEQVWGFNRVFIAEL
jgi:hypothetical protein